MQIEQKKLKKHENKEGVTSEAIKDIDPPVLIKTLVKRIRLFMEINFIENRKFIIQF